jgi:hypothetical protein
MYSRRTRYPLHHAPSLESDKDDRGINEREKERERARESKRERERERL